MKRSQLNIGILLFSLLNVNFLCIEYNKHFIYLEEMNNILKKTGCIDGSFENFLATGNISSKSGLGLMQDKGKLFFFFPNASKSIKFNSTNYKLLLITILN